MKQNMIVYSEVPSPFTKHWSLKCMNESLIEKECIDRPRGSKAAALQRQALDAFPPLIVQFDFLHNTAVTVTGWSGIDHCIFSGVEGLEKPQHHQAPLH